MLWLALHLPLLSLEAFCATLPAADAQRPVALLEHHHIGVVNAAAARRSWNPPNPGSPNARPAPWR